ncbi:hypothetical protein GNI_016420 [Gregarina niphandrodes]|uniref:Uncharacterized protein n=1 Tax=Gregarina niphandrodes TaxID=110365 RepID=A0A023BC94_GRENI|nr:hypothetical protein GNI_016420 [Gregarina niphandrodes]EZG82417.1 hypothetical protein GNI_016420 [Gregarina niphandrodes]|eukprot:XP_011128986.1 hypothetical protein GNI_016420 [Gregarina niphandrodes]
MGQEESKPEKAKEEEEFFARYEQVQDSINPIYRYEGDDDGGGERVADVGSTFNIGEVVDRLRKAKEQRKGKRVNDSEGADRGEGESSASSDSSLRVEVGKKHVERQQNEADGNELDVSVSGEPVILSWVSLEVNSMVNATSGDSMSVRWYLGSDFGDEHNFQVEPFFENVLGSEAEQCACQVPALAIGRYVRAVVTQVVYGWKPLGYEATVGQAYDPLKPNSEIRDTNNVRRLTSSITIGPARLPEKWYSLYYLVLYPSSDISPVDGTAESATTATVNLDAKGDAKRKIEVKVVHPSSNKVREGVRELDNDDEEGEEGNCVDRQETAALKAGVEFLTVRSRQPSDALRFWEESLKREEWSKAAAEVLKIPYEKFLLRLSSESLAPGSPKEMVLRLLERVPPKRHEQREDVKFVAKENQADLLYFWGLINCVQASWDETLVNAISDQDMTPFEFCSVLLQKWLLKMKRRDLVKMT